MIYSHVYVATFNFELLFALVATAATHSGSDLDPAVTSKRESRWYRGSSLLGSGVLGQLAHLHLSKAAKGTEHRTPKPPRAECVSWGFGKHVQLVKTSHLRAVSQVDRWPGTVELGCLRNCPRVVVGLDQWESIF